MKKTKLIFIALVLLLIFVSACSQKEDLDTANARKLIEYNKQKFDSLPLTGQVVNGVREIKLTAYQYDWEPESIVVKKGEKIKITIESRDVPHGFEIEGINIPGWDPDKLIVKGQKAEAEFTAELPGAWDIVCTGYCGPGHAGMKRKFIVRG